MKKLAIALVVLTCLLAGALLPALAETNPVYPAAAEGPKKPTSESAPDAEPATPKATLEPRKTEKPDESVPDAEPAAPKATLEPRKAEKPDESAPDAESAAPKATLEPRKAEKPDESAPDAEPAAPKATEKPDAFEAPEPPHRHGRPGTAHRHHGEKGPQARPDERTPRGPRENERPRHAAPHCRRCEPERSRPHCAGCPFADERPGWQDSRPVEPRQDPLPEPEPRRAEEAGTKMALPLGPGAII